MAPPVFQNVTGGSTSIVPASSLTYAHTTTATTDLLLVTLTVTNIALLSLLQPVPANPIASVTFNGIALTPLVATPSGQPNYTATYYLVAPPQSTAANVVITLGAGFTLGGGNIVSSAVSYSGVNQADPFDATLTSGGIVGLIALNTPGVTLPAAGPVTIEQTVVDVIGVNAVAALDIASFDGKSTELDTQAASLIVILSLLSVRESTFQRAHATQNTVHLYSTTALVGSTYSANTVVLNSPFICVAANTKILMADGTEKEIQDIQRGDEVFGNAERTIINKVAKVSIQYLRPQNKISIVTIKKGSLGENYPNEDMVLTDPHPLIWNGIRKPARCFTEFDGVTWYNNTITAKEMLPINREGTYAIYDLIFDHDGDYIANGVPVQAHSPWCVAESLPKDLYYDVNNWKDERAWHCLAHPLPWDQSLIKVGA